MNAKRMAAILGLLGVALGAFGAHALEGRLTPRGVELWQKGTLYHLVHAVAMLATARKDGGASAATWCFAAGIALFSGSLYALATTEVSAFGAVAPFGGTALLAGWTLLALRRGE